VAKGEKQLNPRYETLKQRLWNHPRALKFLERLESHRASIAMLEDFAGRFATGQHGEAEIRAAVCCEILRNSDPKAILKRITDLHSVSARVLLDLSHIAGEIDQLKSWGVHQEMGFEDWTDFSEEVLGLSDKVADALLLAREQVSDISLNQFLQAMIKGYAAPVVSYKGPPLTVEELLQRTSDPKAIITELKARVEWTEFRLGEEIRARKGADEGAVRARAEKYREVQKRDAVIDKLGKNLQPNAVSKVRHMQMKNRTKKRRD